MRRKLFISALALTLLAAGVGAGIAVSADGQDRLAGSIQSKAGRPAKVRAVRFTRARVAPRSNRATAVSAARGPRGRTGPRGPRGVRGPTGATGPAGPPGPVNLNYAVGSSRFTTSYDAVELACPSGRAVAGGFASDSALVLLNGSAPGSSAASWVIEVSYLGSSGANWVPEVTCV